MTQKERIEMLEIKVEALLNRLDYVLERMESVAPAKKEGATKVITAYGPKVVKDFIKEDELIRSRGG